MVIGDRLKRFVKRRICLRAISKSERVCSVVTFRGSKMAIPSHGWCKSGTGSDGNNRFLPSFASAYL